MKKLFFRLSTSRSLAKLFLLLAVTIVTSAVATKAQAQWGSGFSFWPGSNITAVIKLGDYGSKVDDLVTSSICGDGFVDTQASTLQGQTTDCTVDGKPALCTFKSLTCSCFQVGTCKGGTRTDTMTCPTPGTNGPNSAGCTGIISVTDLNLNPIHSDIQIGGLTLANLDTNSECGAAFPNDSGSGLKKFVMGTLTQECTSGSSAIDDFVLQEKVRSTTDTNPPTPPTASFFSTTQWFDHVDATCNPNNGFPTGACTNDGGAWITFPLATGDTCQASNFTCGQRDGPNGPISGPAPSQCRTDSSGNCQCRCSRCTSAGTLVNLGTPGQGLFVLASDADNAYACPVTVTGN